MRNQQHIFEEFHMDKLILDFFSLLHERYRLNQIKSNYAIPNSVRVYHWYVFSLNAPVESIQDLEKGQLFEVCFQLHILRLVLSDLKGLRMVLKGILRVFL